MCIQAPKCAARLAARCSCLRQATPSPWAPAPTCQVLSLGGGAGRRAGQRRLRAVAGHNDQGAVVAHDDLLAAGLNHLCITRSQALCLCRQRGPRQAVWGCGPRRWRAAGGRRQGRQAARSPSAPSPLPDLAFHIMQWLPAARQRCRRLSHRRPKWAAQPTCRCAPARAATARRRGACAATARERLPARCGQAPQVRSAAELTAACAMAGKEYGGMQEMKWKCQSGCWGELEALPPYR